MRRLDIEIQEIQSSYHLRVSKKELDMPLKKIGNLPKFYYCRNPEHNPPTMIVLPDGIYEHTCPGCGQTTTFTVQRAVWCSKNDSDQGSWSSVGGCNGIVPKRHI